MDSLLSWELVIPAVILAYIVGSGSMKLWRMVYGNDDPASKSGKEREQERRRRADQDHDTVVDLKARVTAMERELRALKDVVTTVEQRQYDQHRMVFFPRSSGQGRPPGEPEGGD